MGIRIPPGRPKSRNTMKDFEKYYYESNGILYRTMDFTPVPCWYDNGYRRFRHYDKKIYKASRVIYYLHTKEWPEVIDHIDGNRSNDNIMNLRAATRSQNNKNVKKRKNNTSGHKGVSFKKKLGKYQVLVQVDGKNIYFGVYSDLEEAAEVARKAREELHGEFARHG
jgi:HNH endonuclease